MDEQGVEFQAERTMGGRYRTGMGAKDTEQEMDNHIVPPHLLAFPLEILSFGLQYHLLSEVFVRMQTLLTEVSE